jgi:hypothetical protein
LTNDARQQYIGSFLDSRQLLEAGHAGPTSGKW